MCVCCVSSPINYVPTTDIKSLKLLGLDVCARFNVHLSRSWKILATILEENCWFSTTRILIDKIWYLAFKKLWKSFNQSCRLILMMPQMPNVQPTNNWRRMVSRQYSSHCVDIMNFQKNRECNLLPKKNVGIFLRRIMLVMKNSRRFNYKHWRGSLSCCWWNQVRTLQRISTKLLAMMKYLIKQLWTRLCTLYQLDCI